MEKSVRTDRILVPPTEIKKKLMSNGCQPVSKENPLFEDYTRYKKWCQTIVRKMKRSMSINRKNLRMEKQRMIGEIVEENEENDFEETVE